MKIRTTIHVQDKTLRLIESASAALKISKTAMVSILVKYMAERTKRPTAFWTGVRYQRRSDRNEWRRLHITPRGDEYEFFIDVRKVCKMSVSFLVTYAIENYLDDLIKLIPGKEDNYRYRNYAISHIIINDIVCWLFCWGIPPDIAKFQ
jgi:hypothetical protein